MHRLILDTDLAMGAPGSDVDDGFALALALDLPDQHIKLITTVNGNTDVDTSTLLTLDLLNRLGRRDIPVVKGARTPLLQPVHDHAARNQAYPGQNLLSAPMHDALAVAVISEPNLVTWQPARVHVETASRLTRGVTVADLLTSRDAPTPNCQIATQVDAAAFMDLFLKHLAQL